MNLRLKKISSFSLAVIVGAAAFGMVLLSEALAAHCNQTAPATMCYQGKTSNNVPPAAQPGSLAKGGTCGACVVSPP